MDYARQFLDTKVSYINEVFGDEVWKDRANKEELEDLLLAVNNAIVADTLNANGLRLYKPMNITDEQFDALIERFINTVENNDNPNKIDFAKLSKLLDKRDELDQLAREMEQGYTDIGDMMQKEFDKLQKHLKEDRGSVCSSISLQIDQTMTMTRQAFRGTLTIESGSDGGGMYDIKLKLNITNKKTNLVATEREFEVHTESLKMFEGELDMESGWYLGADSTGTATILFIPSKYAAPDEPVEYSFGGTLSYFDPFTLMEVTRELSPVTLTVKPSPELDLTYFMQRDLYGDDALTEDIEPVVPGEFAVIINNKGNGDATNVRMVTNQPKIIENEKGLFIDFEFVSSQLNGEEKTLAMGEAIPTDFGNIPAHSQAYAQWWLASSLLGHFVDYDIKATHVSSYGNENLSLLDQVTIHELIHGFTPHASSLAALQSTPRGFLVNDIDDVNDQPDHIYFTDASQQEVSPAVDIFVTKQSNTEYTLTLSSMKQGWSYGSLLDPTAGRRKLLSIKRLSDGTELPVDNMWQTDRTLIDGNEWRYEKRLHVIADFSGSTPDGLTYTETYQLTFEDRAEVALEVASITGMEYEGQPVRTTYVDEVKVQFNKAIQPETFTKDDVTLSVQGQKQDLSSVGFASDDNTLWTLDFTELNRTLPNGYYVLTVQTAGIKDGEGYNGYLAKKADWVLFLGGLVQVTTTEYPLYSGTIIKEKLSETTSSASSPKHAPSDGNVTAVKYGDRYRFTATANDGYEFVNWTLSGAVISTNPVYETTVTSNQDLVANFRKKQFKVEATAGSNGDVIGTGHYDFGAEVNIVAVPDESYALKSWTVNGETIAFTGDTLNVTVDKDMTIIADFERAIYAQTLSLVRGWNWISTYLNEAQPLGDITKYSSRVLSQDDNLIIASETGTTGGISSIASGVAYKIEAVNYFSTTMRGHLFSNAINVQQGWNWISYPYLERRDLANMLPDAEDGDYIVSQAEGFSQYSGGKWEGNLELLSPGQGYLYKSVSSKQLIFDITGSSASEPATSSPLSVDAHRYPNTMNITARIYDNDIEMPAQQYTVYAFVGEELRGISQCVGSNHYLTVYGDDPVSITLIVENAETSETFCTENTLTFTDDVLGSYEKPFAIDMGPTTGISQMTLTAPMTVYTVDGVLVSRDATIKHLRSLPKGVYIVNRRKCYIR